MHEMGGLLRVHCGTEERKDRLSFQGQYACPESALKIFATQANPPHTPLARLAFRKVGSLVDAWDELNLEERWSHDFARDGHANRRRSHLKNKRPIQGERKVNTAEEGGFNAQYWRQIFPFEQFICRGCDRSNISHRLKNDY